MIKPKFRNIKLDELKIGQTVWFEEPCFLDTSVYQTPENNSCSVCGPFLIEKTWMYAEPNPMVGIIDSETGAQRRMCMSWLLVPKEEK